MSKKESLSKLKAKLDRVEAREEKLAEQSNVLREQIEELDAAYIPVREKFIKEGAAKIQEECGWTKEELINALGGTVSEHRQRVYSSSERSYVQLIPLDKDSKLAASQHIKLTPRLGVYDEQTVARDGLIPLLKHTIKMTLDEDNKKRAIAKLAKEEAKAKSKK
jgi:hypothetical protein